ncbi:hypothetical protein MMC22_011504 [Lobaria immixta]|nr:hypothetical protein [Lobaria immixta]
MIQFQLLLFINIVVLPSKLVIAFPHLSPRQGLDIWNVDWGKVGGTILTGIGGWGTVLQNTDPSQEDEDTTTTTTPLPGPASPGPLSSSPAQELDLGQPSGRFIKRPTEDSVPSVSPPCDPDIFSRDCGKSLDQVIYTTGCRTMSPGQVPTATAIAQNAVILDELQRVATGPVLTTTSDLCGAFMFVTSLPKEESDRIRLLPGVLGVSSDTYFLGSKSQPQSQPGVVEPAFKRRQLRKRDRVRQSNAPANLAFISRSPNSPEIPTDFLYDSTGGAGTEVFYMGPGVAMDHPDFANNPITRDDFIFANDVRPGDTLEEGSFGTCGASLVSGSRYGVCKHTRLRPVRTNERLSSLVNSINQILNYIAGRVRRVQSRIDQVQFETLLTTLESGYDVVILTPAEPGYYPAEHAKTHAVIAVGAVDARGANFWFSPTGDDVTVAAPGDVVCANDGGEGQLVSPLAAVAQAAGLAAYFLTLYPQLRAQTQTPLRVKNWMVSNSWARIPGEISSIWNLMEPYTPAPSGVEIPPNLPY